MKGAMIIECLFLDPSIWLRFEMHNGKMIMMLTDSNLPNGPFFSDTYL